ncbi:MAG: serine hydrolase [Bacteroidota bacterium]
MKHKNLITFALGLFLLLPLCNGQAIGGKSNSFTEKTPQEKLNYFIKLADSLRIVGKVPGVGIAIVFNQEILYTGGLGFREVENQIPVEKHTLFSIGSNTKAFTGILAAKLVDQELMDWDEPLKTYIPEFELKEEYITRTVNMADALRHGTGLGRYDEIWKYKTFSRKDLLSQLKDLDFTDSYRTSYGYNNLMYTVVGVAQERVTGKSWEDLVKDEILRPLKMNNSYATFNEFMSSDQRAIGYKGDGKTKEISVDVTSVAPTGAISSTPEDMGNWLRMLLNEGSFAGNKFLSKAAFDYVMMPGDNVGFRAPDEFWYYNAGIGGYYKQGKRTLGHNGSIDGMNSRMALKPDEGFGIFIMTNQISSYKELITDYAEKIFLENDYSRNPDAELGLKLNADFADFTLSLENEGIAAARKIYASMDPKYLEGGMNSLGYQLMNKGDMEKAFYVLKQNTESHPSSSNAFDSLGEYYFILKKFDQALSHYQTSLKLDKKNKNAEMMIRKIKEENQ